MNYTAQQIAEITHSQLIGDGTQLVKNIAFDSRTIYSTKNTAFIAIKTQQNNGEKYIASAVEKGISIIIAEKQLFESETIVWLITDNTIDFLQKLARHHLQQFSLQTIGIAGSNGKTIVKEWLYQSLCNDFSVVKSPKSFNSQIGLPLSLLQINAEHQVGIFEAGISQPDVRH